MNNNPAIMWGTRRISWAQLDQYCSSVVGQLKALGIKAGDRVAIIAPSCPEYIIVIFGLWRMKAVVCPVSTRWPASSVYDYLSCVRASLLLTTTAIKSALPSLSVRCLNLNEVVCFDARRDPGSAQEWKPAFEQEATVIATAGSGGQAKAVVHTWGNHYHSALGSSELIPLTDHDRWLLALPLTHVSGLAIVVRCFLAGAAIVIAAEDNLLETFVKRSITHASMVATQMFRLLQTPEGGRALKTLKCILLGGSAIPSSLLTEVVAQGLNVYLSYGLTETASQVATGRVGGGIKVLRYRQLKIDGGEILVKGEILFKGYIQAGHTVLPLTSDGWFRTGDLGEMDEQGCLTISGRRDNMFICGGENIQPEEIERVLLSMEGIEQAIVVPKEDAEFGCRPVAFVKFRQDAIPAQTLTKHCSLVLPKFKIPVTFHPWPEHLVNQGIKVHRKDFQAPFQACLILIASVNLMNYNA